MVDATLHERLAAVAGDRSFRELGRLTGTNAETVRRYMRGQAPSVDFVAGLCRVTGTSPTWLLTGEGPRHAADARLSTMRGADPGELLAAFAGTIERAVDRLESLERYVQSLETRIRAMAEVDDGEAGADGVAERAERIAGAVAERAPSDAR